MLFWQAQRVGLVDFVGDVETETGISKHPVSLLHALFVPPGDCICEKRRTRSTGEELSRIIFRNCKPKAPKFTALCAVKQAVRSCG